MNETTDRSGTASRTADPAASTASPYCAAMGAVGFSPAEKTELKRALLAACSRRDAATQQPADVSAGTRSTRPASRHVPRRAPHRIPRRAFVGLAAAAAVALGAGGIAVATGLVRVDVPRAIRDLFGGAPADEGIIGQIGATPGIAQTRDGVTVSADTVLGSHDGIVVVLSVAREDGADLGCAVGITGQPSLVPEGLRATVDPLPDGLEVSASCSSYDSDPSDGAVQLAVQLRSDQELAGSTLQLSFERLVSVDAVGSLDGQRLVAQGPWELAVALDYADPTRTVVAGRPIGVGAVEGTAVSIELSPLGVSLAFDVPLFGDAAAGALGTLADTQALSAFWNMSVQAVLLDGTVLDAGAALDPSAPDTWPTLGSRSAASRTVTDASGDVTGYAVRIDAFFDRIVDPADVTMLVLAGAEIPVA